MDDVLFKKNTFDKSPFIFPGMTFLKTKVFENMTRYDQISNTQIGRIDSNHLLISLISNLATLFNGDLYDYARKIENAGRRLVGSMGLVTHYNKGTLFSEGVFYPGCREIITCTSGTWDVMDLWKNWREVCAITVQVHPVTDLTVFEPCVKNKAGLSNPGLAVINIDLPILASQYQMFKSAGNPSVEMFLSQVVLPGFMKSHMDLVLFNKVAAKLGVLPECDVKTNLNFMQVDANIPGDQVVDVVVKALTGKELSSRQILNTVPAFYNDSYLQVISEIKLMPTQQAMWAKEASRFTAAGVCLELNNRFGVEKQLELLTKVRRNRIEAREERWFTSGLTTAEQTYLMDEVTEKVYNRIPT